MRVESFEPSAPLQPFVQAIRVIETATDLVTAPLPEPGLVLGVRYAGRARLAGDGPPRELPDASLSGIRPSMRHIYTLAGGGLVVAVFRSTGAARFFDGALHELFGGMVDLAELTSRSEVDRLRSQLAEASTHAERAVIVDRYLRARLTARSDVIVDAAAAAITRSRGVLKIDALGASLGLSTDRLEKRFRRVVGASPKQLASIVRFRHAIRAYRRDLSLTQLAHDAGYFDQSHLIRDVRTVTGQAPREFLRSPNYWG